MKVKDLKIISAVVISSMIMSFSSVSASAWYSSPIPPVGQETTTAASEAAPTETSPTETSSAEEEIIEVDDDEYEEVELDDPDEEYIIDEDEDEDENEIVITTSSESTETPAASTTAQITYEPVTEFTMYVNESINVRVGPGTAHNIFGGLTAGDSVQVIGKNGDWYAIKFLGGTGFVLNSLLSSTPAATTQATAAATTAAPAPAETEPPATAVVIEPDAPTTEPPAMEDVREPDEDAPAITPDDTDEADESADEQENDDKNDSAAAAGVTNVGGPTAFLIALGGALLIFFLVGLLPIIIHKLHHNKLYQY